MGTDVYRITSLAYGVLPCMRTLTSIPSEMSSKSDKENASVSKLSRRPGGKPENLVQYRTVHAKDKRKRSSNTIDDGASTPREFDPRIRNPAPGSMHLRQTQPLGELSEVPDSEEDIGSSGSEPASKRTRHSLKTSYKTHSGLPTELTFYPETWVEILKHAKNQFLIWLVTQCPWPEREIHLVNAEHYLIAAIDIYCGKDHEIEEGYYPTYKREMSTLIFEESSVFHNALFTRARQIAKENYNLYPDWNGGFGQAAYNLYVSTSAQELLVSSQFMHHGIDDQGKRNNFGHPALEELSTFFYGSADSVGVLFPVETGDALPHNALALACEALHCSLTELVDGIEYTFSATPIYKGMHNVLMGLIDKTDKNAYHGLKLRHSLEKWACNGRFRCGNHQGSSQTYGLQVYLD